MCEGEREWRESKRNIENEKEIESMWGRERMERE